MNNQGAEAGGGERADQGGLCVDRRHSKRTREARGRREPFELEERSGACRLPRGSKTTLAVCLARTKGVRGQAGSTARQRRGGRRADEERGEGSRLVRVAVEQERKRERAEVTSARPGSV